MTYGGLHENSQHNHKLENWTFANASARNAFSDFNADDVGKVAYDTDTHTYWRLDSLTPITWAAVMAGSEVSGADLSAHAALVADNTTTHGHITLEEVRDLVGTLLQSGTGISITVDDAGDHITITATSTLDTEAVQDIVGGMMEIGASPLLAVQYNDGTGKVIYDIDAVEFANAVHGMILAGDNVTLDWDSGAGTITINSSGDSETPLTNPMTTYGDMIYGGTLALHNYALASEGTTATATHDNTTNVPAQAIDGDTSGSSAWGVGEEGTGDSIRLDLGAVRTISYVRAFWYGTPNYAQAYKIQSSDDGSTGWVDRATLTSSGGADPLTALASPVDARYWRLLITSGGFGGNWPALREIQLFAATTSEGAPARLPIGTNGQVLTVVDGTPAWADSSGGGGDGGPVNPTSAVRASVSAGSNITVAADTDVTVPFDTLLIDDTRFNTTTHEWTPPAGKLYIDAVIALAYETATFVIVEILKNGSQLAYSILPKGGIADSDNVSIHVSAIDDANGTDVYKIIVHSDEDSSLVRLYTYFNAFMIGGGAGSNSFTYFERMAALLEPDALEPLQIDTFSYVIGSGVTKYIVAAWYTQLGGSGRMEVRDPRAPLPLRGVTLSGIGSSATAAIIDPALPTYDDAQVTYYERLQAIDDLQTRQIVFTADNQTIPLLPGAYGAIIRHVTNFNMTWVIARFGAYGYNLANEISDDGSTGHQRNANTLMLPVHKHTINAAQSGAHGGDGDSKGSVVYVLLPADWSHVDDPHEGTYVFRDDFMSTLDTTDKWTKVEGYTNGVAIDTRYQWLFMDGGSSWGEYSLITQDPYGRVDGLTLEADVYLPYPSDPIPLVGWNDGTGNIDADFAHCLVMSAEFNVINCYEGGTLRGAVGSGVTRGCTYRVRIVLTTTGATYWIQGGPQYPALGGASWQNITPGTSSSAVGSLYPGLLNINHPVYFSDPKVYNAS